MSRTPNAKIVSLRTMGRVLGVVFSGGGGGVERKERET